MGTKTSFLTLSGKNVFSFPSLLAVRLFFFRSPSPSPSPPAPSASPAPPAPSPSHPHDIIIEKIQLCCQIFDFRTMTMMVDSSTAATTVEQEAIKQKDVSKRRQRKMMKMMMIVPERMKNLTQQPQQSISSPSLLDVLSSFASLAQLKLHSLQELCVWLDEGQHQQQPSSSPAPRGCEGVRDPLLLDQFFVMIRKNLFRPLPPSASELGKKRKRNGSQGNTTRKSSW